MDPGKACEQGLACAASPIMLTLVITVHAKGMAALPGLPQGQQNGTGLVALQLAVAGSS